MSAASITVVASYGPACASAEGLAALREAGADLLRLNGSHLRPGQLAQALDLAEQGGWTPDLILLDLQGGKTRIGWLSEARELRAGERLTLVSSELQAGPNPELVPVDRPAFLRALVPGDRLRVDDGRLGLRVLAGHGTRVSVEAECDGVIAPRKGLARAGGSQDPEPHLLPGDRALLDRALPRGVQTLAVSYANDPDLLRLVRRHAARLAPDRVLRVVAKLEHPQALARWEALAAAADALWFCRGDLGAELGPERVPAAQRRLLAEALPGTPLLVAGQVLHHMCGSPRPTRAELCQAGDLLHAGATGFVLSDETALGPHGPEAVRWLRRLAEAESTPQNDSATTSK